MVDKKLGEIHEWEEKRKPSWSELDSNMLELVLKRLGFVDIHRFKSVCSSWNKATKSFTSSPSYSPTPMLMLPSDHHDTHSRLFLNLGEDKVYKFNNLFEGILDAQCVGSSHGIMVVSDKWSNLFVVNPLSGQRLQLPRIIKFRRFEMEREWFFKYLIEIFVHKAVVLLPDPSRTHNSSFVVVILYGFHEDYGAGPSELAYYNSQDKNWTQFGESEKYWDILLHNDQLYALKERISLKHKVELKERLFVEVWDFENKDFRTKILLSDSAPVDTWDYHARMYLAVSMGELLVLTQFDNASDNEELPQWERLIRTLEFRVTKVDLRAKKCENVESLEGRALFVGRNQSISVSTGDFSECQENSIYFVESIKPLHYWIGVYNLREKVVKHLHVPDDFGDDKTALWIIPNPQEIHEI